VERVKVWQDRWLPTPGLQFIKCAPEGKEEWMVKELMSENGEEWNGDLIRELFEGRLRRGLLHIHQSTKTSRQG